MRQGINQLQLHRLAASWPPVLSSYHRNRWYKQRHGGLVELTARPDDTPSTDSFTEEGANFEDEFAEVGEADFQKDFDEDGTLIDLTTLRICTM